MGRMESFGGINPVQRQESNPVKLSAEEIAQLEKELEDFDPALKFGAAEDIIAEMNAVFDRNEKPTSEQWKRYTDISSKMYKIQSDARDLGIDPNDPTLVKMLVEFNKISDRRRTLN